MKNFPDFVWNHPAWRPSLQKIFNYEAPFYDLAKYEAVVPGAGLRIWNELQAEYIHQQSMAERRATLNKTLKEFGPKIPELK